MNIIPTVVSQHAEEAAMQWLLRHDAVGAPHYDLADLTKLDNRVDAHLDGLRISGEAGWEACQEQQWIEEEGEVFVAGFLAGDSGDMERLARVLESINQQPQLVRAMVAALGWVDSGFSAPLIAKCLKSEKPLQRHIGVAASAILRREPYRVLLYARRNESGRLRLREWKALGELGKVDQVGSALEALDSDAEHRRLAIYVAGQLGDPESMPWFIDQMALAKLACVAEE
jgi:uncharacterized protein (TIGR02270 family)